MSIQIIFMIVLACAFLAHSFSCTESSSDGFASLEEKAALRGDADANDVPIEIESFSPEESPVLLPSEGKKTFALSLSKGSSPILRYSWVLDGTVISETNKPFYDLDAEPVSPGQHELVVQIENSKFSASHSFILFKNTPPVVTFVSPAADFSGPIDCTSVTGKEFQISTSDVDENEISVSWLINDSATATGEMLTIAEGGLSAKFVGDCKYVGEIKLDVTANDGTDDTTETWKFTLIDPTSVNILESSPSLDPVVFKSNETKIFSVVAIGKNNLAYSWLINGTIIDGKSSSTESISAAELNIGAQTLEVIVSDGDTSASKLWNVYKNVPPSLSNPLPLTDLKKINFKNFFNFTINASDQNGDTIIYTWTLNDLASANIASSNDATGSQAVFTPNLSLAGSHNLKVTASDGIETSSYTWAVQVNRFSNFCNDLVAGQVCTVMGPIGLGSDTDVADNEIIAKPYYIADDGAGNIFFSDYQAGVIWFYNRSASPVTRINATVQPGQAAVVAGNGAWGNTADGVQARDYQIYGPMGVTYNAGDDQLFVSEYSRHRVVRFDSSGLSKIVFGRGNGTNNLTSNTNGSVGTNHVCVNPRDLEYDEPNDVLFVACGGSHAVKYATNADDADVNQILGYIAAGRLNGSNALAANNGDGAIGGAGAGANNPFGLDLDAQGNLYIASYGRCKVRVWNRGALSKDFFGGAVSVAAGSIGTLSGTGTCNNTTNDVAYNAAIYNRPYDLAVLPNAGNTDIDGFFVSATNGHRLYFVNNTAAGMSFGNNAIASYQVSQVAGTGNAEFGGDGTVGVSSPIYTPIGMFVEADKSGLVFADYNNNRMRSLDLTNSSGTLSTVLGNGNASFGFNGDVSMAANDMLLYAPTRMTISNNILYLSDFSNYRIRKLDLATGTAETAVGEGAGILNEGLPSTIRSYGITSVATINDLIIFGDNQRWNSNGSAINQNCAIRGLNPTFSSISVFNELIPSNWVSTLGGNYGLGCAAWTDIDFDGTAMANVSFRPESFDFVNGKLIAADYYFHCIYSVDSSGIAHREVGSCGTTASDYGNVSNVLVSSGNAKFRYPRAIRADPEYPNSENYFVADQYDQGSTLVKYVNNSASVVTINGIDINPGFISTVFVIGSIRINDIAAFENQICVSHGYQDGSVSNQAVACYDRNGSFNTVTKWIGAPLGSSVAAAVAVGTEMEGVPSTTVKMWNPYGLAFDSVGNLYISERDGHKIRLVKKWW